MTAVDWAYKARVLSAPSHTRGNTPSMIAAAMAIVCTRATKETIVPSALVIHSKMRMICARAVVIPHICDTHDALASRSLFHKVQSIPAHYQNLPFAPPLINSASLAV